MPLKSEIYKEILKSYDKDRSIAEERLKNNKKAIYTAVPRIKEIDDEITKSSINMARLVIDSPENKDLILDRKSVV